MKQHPLWSTVYMMRVALRAAGLFLIPFCFQGCANVFVTPPPPDIVRELSEQWLALMLQGDYKSAYELTTPGYRATHSARDHGRSYAGVAMWQDAKISKVTCSPAGEENRCIAMLMISYKAPRGGFTNTRPLELVWLRGERGSWQLYSD